MTANTFAALRELLIVQTMAFVGLLDYKGVAAYTTLNCGA